MGHVDGRDLLVDQVAAATGGFHMIGWEHEASSLSYWTRLEDQTLEKRRWTYAEKVPRKAENAGSGYVPVLDANGFSGGRFETRGLGRERKLVRSEEHTSELQSLMRISYAVFCLKT